MPQSIEPQSGGEAMKVLLVLLFLGGAASAYGARAVTDEMGRAVSIPDRPHRLICLMPSVVDDVYALGAGGDVVAVSDYSKYPSEARNKPSIGLPLNPSIERIVSLHPDLVLGDGNMNQRATIEQLQKLDIPVFLVTPHGVEGIYRSIASLGKVLNRNASARDLIQRLRVRVDAVHSRVRGKPTIRILMPIWYNPITTIGKHAFITELIEIAGGLSVSGDLEQEWPQVSMEAVLAWAPQGLLLVQGSKISLEQIQGLAGWQSLPAVRNRRLFTVDDRIDSPSPVAFDALEQLAEQFHP
jgi:iron complex transport system substrate-binding protein